jgi:hypothetical protein
MMPIRAGHCARAFSGSDQAESIFREVARHCAAVAGGIPFAHLLSLERAFAKLLSLPPAQYGSRANLVLLSPLFA